MPIYEFRCTHCGAVAEVFRKADDRNDAETCQCGEDMARVFTSPRVVVKGGEESPKTLTQRFHNLKRDEQIFENPRSREIVRLTGSKAERKAQIAKSLEKAGYPVTSSKDVTTHNL